MNASMLTVRFTQEEMSALKRVARLNLRRPRDQVRLIVLQALDIADECGDQAVVGLQSPEAADNTNGKEVVQVEWS